MKRLDNGILLGDRKSVIAQMNYSDSSCSEGTESKRGNQTVLIVPMPHPGVKCVRPLTVFGYDDAPHGHAEVWLEMLSWMSQRLYLAKVEGSRFHNRGWDQEESITITVSLIVGGLLLNMHSLRSSHRILRPYYIFFRYASSRIRYDC